MKTPDGFEGASGRDRVRTDPRFLEKGANPKIAKII